MEKPKFKEGALVKYKVEKQWRYNNVVDSYFNTEVGMHMYRLDEPIALPLYREENLTAVSDKEEQWLRQMVRDNKLLFGETGYLYTKDGEEYKSNKCSSSCVVCGRYVTEGNDICSECKKL